MNKIYRFLFLNIILLVGSSVICIAQRTPQDNALAAIRRAKGCLYKCQELNCLETSVREYNRIRASNPNANLPPHNLGTKLEKLRKKCSDTYVAEALRKGYVKGTQIKILGVDNLANLLIFEESLKFDKTLIKIELKQVKSQLKQLNKQKAVVRSDKETLKKIADEEVELKNKVNDLNTELSEKKELYNENFGIKMKLMQWFIKVAYKLKIIK